MNKILFVGQAMPRFKKDPHDWPSLNTWLKNVGVDESHIKKHFYYSALVDYFPGSANGSHIVPTKQQIDEERDRLRKTLTDFEPDIVVTVGKLSLTYCLNKNIISLSEYIGKSYKVNPYGLLDKELLIIPLPHPSGASVWHKKENNKKLLLKALKLIKINI